jgi:hypothetical protein
MGILTRTQDDYFVITADHMVTGTNTKRAPTRPSSDYHIWTGEQWTESRGLGLRFASLEEADEYVRANYAKLRG